MELKTETKTPDRRQRKSRAALHQALLTLIASKPYEAITIDDITAEADVARATFYAHYKDKPALLLEAGTELISALAERAAQTRMFSTVYTGEAVSKIFLHAAEHRHLYRLIISGEGGQAVRSRAIAAFEAAAQEAWSRMSEQAGRTPRPLMPVAATAFVGALLRTIEAWLDADPPANLATTATDFLRTQVGGLEWVLGFDPGELEADFVTFRPSSPRP